MYTGRGNLMYNFCFLQLKMWISFLIPRIEDGNNFGVSIQEDTLGEVRTVEAEAASFLDQISRYLLTRGRIVTKIAKYPHVVRLPSQYSFDSCFDNFKISLLNKRDSKPFKLPIEPYSGRLQTGDPRFGRKRISEFETCPHGDS